MSALNKRRLICFGLIFAAFFTFYYTFALQILPLTSNGKEIGLMQIIFTASVVLSMIIISHARKSLSKKILYAFFIAIPILVSLMFTIQYFIVRLAITIIIGLFLGISQLAFVGFFWRLFPSSKRGQSAAVIVFIALPIYFLISPILNSEMSVLVGFISLLLVLALVAALKLGKIEDENKQENFPEKRTIILYAIPWIIFSLINATFSRTIAIHNEQSISSQLFLILSVLQIFGALAGALIAGKIADQMGRRTTLAVSITLYGISMVISGLTLSESSLFFSFLLDGLSWGIILTTYIFIIWGDLANSRNYLLVYTIGLSVFFATAGLGYFPINLFDVPVNALIGCSLIFLCNVPLALAPELLPSEGKEKSQMENYLKKVQEVAKNLDD